MEELAAATRDLPVAVLTGAAFAAPEGSGKPAVNAAVLLDKGRILLEQHKRLLPFYDVFDEQRYFQAGRSQQVVELDGVRLAVSVCEDAWNDKHFWPRRLYSTDPMEELMAQRPAIHVNISASPFWHGKREVRREMLAAIARRDGIPVVLSNQVGGNDSLIFDGIFAGAEQPGRAGGAGGVVCRGPCGGGSVYRAGYRRTGDGRHAKPPGTRWCWARATTCASAASAR